MVNLLSRFYNLTGGQVVGPRKVSPTRYMAPTTQVEMLSTETQISWEVYWAFIQAL